MGRGDPHPQHPRPDAEAKRRVELQRLAVDTGGNRAVRVDLERGRRPLPPPAPGEPLADPVPAAAPMTAIPSTPSSSRGRVPEPTTRPSR